MEEIKEYLIETDEWVIEDSIDGNGNLNLKFIKRDTTKTLTPEEINYIKENIKDLGKWKKYKELKKELKN